MEQYITDELMDTSDDEKRLFRAESDIHQYGWPFWVLHGLSRVNRSFYNVHSVAIWFGDCMVCFYEAAQTA